MPKTEPIRVALTALGCPKNLVDSEKMLGLLAQAGCVVGADPADADVILINTCSFIAPARDESMQAIRQAVALKRRGRVRRVVVAGCLAEMAKGELLAAEPGIDAVVGVFDRDSIAQAVLGAARVPSAAGGRRLSARSGCLRQEPGQDAHATHGQDARATKRRLGACASDRGRLRLTPRHTAYLRIAEGCSSGCSYCTIPSIRGPLRSKAMAEIVAEARELLADGAVELNLIAQDTTAYGRDRRDGSNLAKLLRKLDRLDGLKWLRVMYAHPASLTDAVMDAMAECPRVVKYIDMPIQHAADAVLDRMRRRYDQATLDRVLDGLRRRMPDIAIRTTFIVGFPGEGPEEFAELLAFVKRQQFQAVGVFPYYPEAGTPAARLGGQVADRDKRLRRGRLMRAQQKIAFAANAASVGRRVELLVDGPDPAGRCIARHAGQAPEIDSVCILGRAVSPGRIVRRRIVGYDGYDLVVE
jgi:ribosomal protein S12 methylthiotransferase